MKKNKIPVDVQEEMYKLATKCVIEIRNEITCEAGINLLYAKFLSIYIDKRHDENL